jgi:hypothetical protein
MAGLHFRQAGDDHAPVRREAVLQVNAGGLRGRFTDILKIFYGANAFISRFQHTNMHIIKLITRNRHCYVFFKNLIPWRDSNPGLLYLRRKRCPLRHAARASWKFFKYK